MILPDIITARVGQILPSFPQQVPATVPPEQPSAADSVGVFDAEFKQLFAKARPVRASVYEAARVMDHPVESGGTITDHRVIQPIEVELSMLLVEADYRDTYNQIKTLYNSATLLTVQTRTGSYGNMLIAELPHEESPDIQDAITLALRLREAILVTVQFQALPPKAVAKPRAASTVKRGQQTSKPATGPAVQQAARDTQSALRSIVGDAFVLGGGG